MEAVKRSGLDHAAIALSRHLRKVAERSEDELEPEDLASIVTASAALREIEQARANTVLRALGRRLDSMPVDELERLLNRIEVGEESDAN